MTKPLVARKELSGTSVPQLVFWLLVVSSLNYFKMHAWSTSMLLLLHSAFMISAVKLLLKGEVGVCSLNGHGNYIVDHGKSWNCVFEFLLEPCISILILRPPRVTTHSRHCYSMRSMEPNCRIFWFGVPV